MKKNRMKFLIIEFLLLLLAVFFVWKIFDQNVAEPRIAVILPESGDKRWDALIKGMKQAAAENNVHMIICNTEEIDGPEAEREFIKEQKDNDIDGFILYPAPGRETENMLKKECGNKPYLLISDSLAVKEGETASPKIQPDHREIGRRSYETWISHQDFTSARLRHPSCTYFAEYGWDAKSYCKYGYRENTGLLTLLRGCTGTYQSSSICHENRTEIFGFT